jgi:hypothetical protein
MTQEDCFILAFVQSDRDQTHHSISKSRESVPASFAAPDGSW